jgi:hypothetical protein
MSLRTIVLSLMGALALLLLTQCSSYQTKTVTPMATDLPAVATNIPTTPSSMPSTPTTEPPTPTNIQATRTIESPTPTLAQAPSTSTVLPAASGSFDGATLVQERCIKCHGIVRIQQAAKTRDEWQATVSRMIGRGANLSSDEKDAVINYLAETYKK